MGEVGSFLLGGGVAGLAFKALTEKPPEVDAPPTIDPDEEERRVADKRRRSERRAKGGFGAADTLSAGVTTPTAKGSKTFLGG